MKFLLFLVSTLFIPLTSFAAVTPDRTIPVYANYCNYGYCQTPRVYHYTPTPYVPVVQYSPIYVAPRVAPVRYYRYTQPVYTQYHYYTPRLTSYYW